MSRAGTTVQTVLALLLAVFLSAHLLAPSSGYPAEARAGGAGFVGHSQGSCHHESGTDNAGQLRRTRARVGSHLDPKTWPPLTGPTAFTGVDAFDKAHDGRTALRYGDRVPRPDTSPPALQVFRI